MVVRHRPRQGRGGYRDGRHDGTWKLYYRDGTLFEEVTYTLGVRDGPWRMYHRNGQLAEDRTWARGHQTGLQTDYDEAGRKLGEGAWHDGQPSGSWRCWTDGVERSIPAPGTSVTPAAACRATASGVPVTTPAASPPAGAPDRLHPGPCEGIGDGDGDGTLDGVPDSRVDYRYEGGRLLSLTTWYLGVPNPGAHTEYLYDDAGRAIGERFDCDGQGASFEEETRYVFGADGRKRLGVMTEGPEHARICSVRPADDPAPRGDGDASLAVERVVHDWDAELRALGSAAREGEAPDAVVQFTWSSEGNVVAEAWDNDADGTFDEVLRFVYDRFGNLMLEYHDDGPDGVVDVFLRYSYGCWAEGP